MAFTRVFLAGPQVQVGDKEAMEKEVSTAKIST
jgi:hypothetical protein